jgi:protein TonB
MFQESLVESTPHLRTQSRWPVLISVAMQVSIITLAITIPLLRPEVLPHQALNKLDFLLSPIKPPAPPPPPQVIHVQTAQESSAPAAPATQPPQIQSSLAHPFFTDANPVDTPAISMVSGNPYANTTSFEPSSAPLTPHVAPTPTPAANAGPLRISEGVLAGNLIAPIRPQYPQIAKFAGVQGTVIIQAIISKTGTIESAHVVSGPAMLQAAALDAVRSARYRPYLLDHQPTEVETTFSINFRLGSS